MKILKALVLGLYFYVMLVGILPYYAIIFIWLISLLILMDGHLHNGYDIDYIAYNSTLYDTNPFLKAVFCVMALIVCVELKNIYVSIFTLIAMTFISICIGKVPINKYKSLMSVPLYFIMLSTITMAVEIKGGIQITRSGQIEGVKLILLAISSISCLYALTLSTPVAELIEVFRKMKIPELVIELMFLIYRFIFVLLDVMYNMINAAKVRNGLAGYKNTIKSYGYIARNLFIYSLKKINNYYDAMMGRKYDGSIAFYCEFKKCSLKDILFCVIYFMIVGVICLV